MTDKVIAETSYTDQRTLTEIEMSDKVIAETAHITQSTATELAQKDKVIADTSFVTQKTLTEVEEKDRIIAETSKSTAEIDKIANEAIYLEQKTVTELANTSDTKPTDLGKMTGSNITGLLAIQKTKLEGETSLLAQKSNTELAQTSDTVKTGEPYLNSSSTVTGVIDKQKTLYSAQTDGFTRDAEQKVLKIMTDAWSVLATQSLTDASSTNLDNASLGSVVNKAKAGIGV